MVRSSSTVALSVVCIHLVVFPFPLSSGESKNKQTKNTLQVEDAALNFFFKVKIGEDTDAVLSLVTDFPVYCP